VPDAAEASAKIEKESIIKMPITPINRNLNFIYFLNFTLAVIPFYYNNKIKILSENCGKNVDIYIISVPFAPNL
jgi:hypothetical protein